MKKINLLRNVFLLLTCLLPNPLLAQSEDERDIVSKYQSGQATGMKVTILLASANCWPTPVYLKWN